MKYIPFLQKFLSPYYDVIIPVGYIYNDNYLIDKAIIFNNKEVTSHHRHYLCSALV